MAQITRAFTIRAARIARRADRLAMALTRRHRRPLSLYAGIGALILANTVLGPVIGYGLAAIVGVIAFFVLRSLGDDLPRDSTEV